MTEKEKVKKAYSEVEQELSAERDRKIKEQVKGIVKQTLEKIDKLKGQREKIDKRIKVLKLDIDDLKEGHLDRIKERQEKDPEAKRVSVIVIKEKEVIREPYPVNPWYRPYEIYWNHTTTYPDTNNVYCDNGTGSAPLLTTTTENSASASVNLAMNTVNAKPNYTVFTLNNSSAKDNVIGTYKINNQIVHLR